jgi:large subunit ribosomal protein L24
MKIKKGDKVQVIAGKCKGEEGKVLVVDSKNNKVIVEGVNMVKKHVKASATNPQSGIVSKEAPLDASNVMYLYKGKPVRLGYTVEVADGKNVKKRIAKPSGDLID